MSTRPLPIRKNSLRLKGWDYRNGGCYFITFCTHQRACILEDEAIIQEITTIIDKVPTYKGSKHVVVIEWIAMANHMHLLIYLDAGTKHFNRPQPNNAPGSVGAIVGTLKREISKKIRPYLDENFPKVWQRGYYDRIIRNEKEFNAIREYIRMNPVRWDEDRDNLDSLLSRMPPHR